MQCVHIKEWMQHKFVCADHHVIEIAEELVVAIVNYAPSLIQKQIMYLSSTV